MIWTATQRRNLFLRCAAVQIILYALPVATQRKPMHHIINQP